ANPRTAGRALPSGQVDAWFVWMFTCISSALFVLAAWQLNRLTLILSPVALSSVFVYSYTKRFTAASHLFLGWCLAIAPAGAWIAIRGNLTPIPLPLLLFLIPFTSAFLL